jgi:DNA-binding transcriptional LysR family regulator
VTEFRRMHPQITIEVLASDAVLDLVANRADLAPRVAFGGLPDMNYQAIAVADIEVGLFASPRYLAGRQPIKAPEALERHDWILARERPGVSHLPLSDSSREVKIALNPAIRTTDFAGVLRFVAAGAGLAPLPTLLTRKWIDEGSLVRILPAWAWSGLKLHAISAPGRQLSARVRAFRDHVIENLSR